MADEEKKIDKKKSKKDKVHNNVIDTEPTMNEAVLDRQQRRKLAIAMRRNKSKIARGRARAARRPATIDKLKKRARKTAIQVIRKKVAQKQGQNYNNLDTTQKMRIDKLVQQKKSLVDRIAKKLLPTMRKREKERMMHVKSVKESNHSTPTKRFHEVRNKDGSIKLDRRFRAFKKKAQTQTESFSSTRELLGIIESVDHNVLYEKVWNALIEKSNNSGIRYDIVKEVYDRGESAWEKLGECDCSKQQYGMARVNSFIKGGKAQKTLDKDLWKKHKALEEKKILSLDEEFGFRFLNEGDMLDKALSAIKRHVDRGEKLMDVAWEVSRAKGVEYSAHDLVKKYKERHGEETAKPSNPALRQKLIKKYGSIRQRRAIGEEHGAGFEGTDKVTKKYKKDTPGQTVNEETECQLIGMKQIKEFEKIVDQLFKKYGIDFQFTKHFGERMSHDRNDPCITLKELAEFIKKIYAKQGRPLKGVAGAEAVIKDIQTNLNIPVAVEYDEKNDEIDVVMKTIMRKKDFRTPNKIIKY